MSQIVRTAERQSAASPERQAPWRLGPWLLVAVFGLYVVATLLLYPTYQYRVSPDQTAYFSIAGKYARADWYSAISSHWPPLLMWLIALGLKAGLEATPAATLIDVASSFLLLWSCDRLSRRLGINSVARHSLLALVAVYCLRFTLTEVRADTLLASLLTWYLVLVSDASLLTTVRGACAAGAVAGLAYYAKPYAFYFVLAHLAIVTALDCWTLSRPWTPVLRRTGIVAVTMLAVVAPWVACISWKYHRFTISTAGDEQFRVDAPTNDPNVVNIGLAPPPNSTAYNYWEEPTRLNLPPWSPWQSRADLEYYVGRIGSNILTLLVWTFFVSIAALPIFGILIVRWFRQGRDRTMGILLSAVIVYSGGYCLITVIDRYLWPVAIWVAVLAFSLLPSGRKTIFTVLLALSFLYHPIIGLRVFRHQGESEHEIAQALNTRLGLKGNVASLSEWLRSLYICYFAGLPYYGVPAPGSSGDIQHQLAQYNIQYLFVWKDQPIPPHLLDGMRKISTTDIPPDLQVYAREP